MNNVNTNLKIYFARSITGRTFDEVMRYYEYVSHRFTLLGVQVYHPMVGKEKLRCDKKFKAQGYEGIPCSTNHGIAERDLWMVSQADIVFCDLTDTTEVSIGCVGELAVAHWLRKHTVVVIPEGNIHEHAFMLEFADVRFFAHMEAVEYLDDLVRSTSGYISPEFQEILKKFKEA
jgi:nucleoside 2-deoxyribosyltransferase